MTTTNVVQLSSITPHPSVEYWSVCKVEALFETPFLELVYRAAQVHREHFNPGAIQLSTLMSIKTGGCPEDCGYCPRLSYLAFIKLSILLCNMIKRDQITFP